VKITCRSFLSRNHKSSTVMGLWDFTSKMAEGDRTKRHIFGLINFIQKMKKTCFTFALKYEGIFSQPNISMQIFKYCIKYIYFYILINIKDFFYSSIFFFFLFILFFSKNFNNSTFNWFIVLCFNHEIRKMKKRNNIKKLQRLFNVYVVPIGLCPW